MPTKEDVRHDLLLTIVIALAILFSTGIVGPGAFPGTTVILPSA